MMKIVTVVLAVFLATALGVIGYGAVKYLRLQEAHRLSCEQCKALERRSAELAAEVKRFSDNESRNQLEPMIAAIRVGNEIKDAALEIGRSTTSLQRDKATEAFDKLVESVKGRRVVLKGVVKDIGKRFVGWSQMYLSLIVSEGFDVKFIYEKESKAKLLGLSAGDELVLEGYVISTGDLMHRLTVGGPSRVETTQYSKACALMQTSANHQEGRALTPEEFMRRMNEGVKKVHQ